MLLRRLALVALAFVMLKYFRQAGELLDQYGLLLHEQPGIGRFAFAAICLFSGLACLGYGFNTGDRWHKSAAYQIAGVALVFLGLQFVRTLF